PSSRRRVRLTWSTPRTWVVGDVPTDAGALGFNPQLRDNLLFLSTPYDLSAAKFKKLDSTTCLDAWGGSLNQVVLLNRDNAFWGGKHNFNGGTATRFVAPVGAFKAVYVGPKKRHQRGPFMGQKEPGSCHCEDVYFQHVGPDRSERRFKGAVVGIPT